MKRTKKTKKNRKNKVLLSGLIIVIFFIVMSFIIKDNRKLTFVEKTIKDSTLFINQIISFPLKIFNNNKNLKIVEQNISNKKEVEIENLKKELEELKQTLNLKHLVSEYEEVNATIISRNLGYWYNTIIIDKGRKDGIKKDMAVTTAEALIGKVIKVSRNNSTIKLLTSSDINNKVSVQIKVDNNYIYGILTSFNEKEGSYIIEGISDTKNIKIGNLVSTTGMGNIFPSGILIGEVIEIGKDNFDLEAIIKVKPSFNIDNFNYVKVLRKKQ